LSKTRCGINVLYLLTGPIANIEHHVRVKEGSASISHIDKSHCYFIDQLGVIIE